MDITSEVIELRKVRADTPKLDRNGNPLKGQAAKGLGKKPGSVNKTTRELKEMILTALDEVGGVDYLVQQAHLNPQAFLSLVGRVLPKDMNLKVGVAPIIIDEFPGIK